MGRALNENLSALSQLSILRKTFGPEMELVHAYFMNIGGYYLDFEKVNRKAMRPSDEPGRQSETEEKARQAAWDKGNLRSSSEPVRLDEHLILPETTTSTPNSEKILEVPPLGSISPKYRSMKMPTPVHVPRLGAISPGPKTDIKTDNISFSRNVGDTSNDEGSGNQESVIDPGKIVPHHLKNMPSATTILELEDGVRYNLERLKMKRWTLTAAEILEAANLRHLFDHLPEISARELEGLGNGDTVVKFLAVLQLCWFLVQLIGRRSNNLPLSQLEIATLAFAASSLFTYILLWERPRGIEHRYKIEASQLPKKTDFTSLAQTGPIGFTVLFSKPEGKRTHDYLDLLSIPNQAIHGVYLHGLKNYKGNILARIVLKCSASLPRGRCQILDESILMIGSAFGGILFGTIHCLAWNFTYPTSIEGRLWRICSVLTTTIPLGTIVFYAGKYHAQIVLERYLSGRTRLEEVVFADHVEYCVITLLISCYSVARLFLLVEIFRSLLYLPPEAFKDTWSGSFPHWG